MGSDVGYLQTKISNLNDKIEETSKKLDEYTLQIDNLVVIHNNIKKNSERIDKWVSEGIVMRVGLDKQIEEMSTMICKLAMEKIKEVAQNSHDKEIIEIEFDIRKKVLEAFNLVEESNAHRLNEIVRLIRAIAKKYGLPYKEINYFKPRFLEMDKHKLKIKELEAVVD